MNESEINIVEALMERLTKAVAFQYPGKLAPGVVTSYLPNKEWYVSIVRYQDGLDDKELMHSAKNKSLYLALRETATQLISSAVREMTPMDELDLFLGNGFQKKEA